MIRTVLILLTALPQLVPPGTCLCQFVRIGASHEPDAVRNRLPKSEGGVHDDRAASVCGCCRLKHRGTPNQDVAAANSISSDDVQSANTGEYSDRHSEQHCPGCPAASNRAHETVTGLSDRIERLIDWLDCTTSFSAARPLPQLRHVFLPVVSSNARSTLLRLAHALRC